MNSQLERSRASATINESQAFIDRSYEERTDADDSYLHIRFFSALQLYEPCKRIFDMLIDFSLACDDAKDVLKNKSDVYKQEIKWLENEKNTWLLLNALYRSRIGEDIQNELLITTNLNEYDLVANFYRTNSIIREGQLVIDWLENIAAKSCDENSEPDLSVYTDSTVAWENTLYQLQVGNNVTFNSTRPMVDAMDPDAPHRQGKRLHDIDERDEERLLARIFREIRCGRFEKTAELCSTFGHQWRAAVLQGWLLHKDPNYDTSNGLLQIVGNPNRDLWKMCAWSITKQSNVSSTWKAIIGVLCGNLKTAKYMCKNWEDLLWIHMKVFVDIRVEREIRDNIAKKFANLPDEYWNFKYNLEEIFEALAGCNDNEIRIETASQIRQIQRMIILNKCPELIEILSEWCNEEDCDSNIVRISTHIVLWIRIVGYDCNQQHANSIISVYVKILLKIGNVDMVAHYVSYLPENDQIQLYMEFLENVVEPSEQVKCLEAAKRCGLNINEITERLARAIGERQGEYRDELDLVSELTDEERKKINALDWLMYDTQQRAAAIWQANYLIRYFLSRKNLEGAKQAFNKITDDSIGAVLNEFGTSGETYDSSVLPPKVNAALREYLCYQVYLDAEEQFADWFRMFHTEKPNEPSKPKLNAEYTERVAYECYLKTYHDQLARWKLLIDKKTKEVASYLYNVLLFPEGGWLGNDQYKESSSRSKQLDVLRRMYIPKVFFLLNIIFHSTKQYDQCLELSVLLVSEKYKLYELYSKKELGKVNIQFCEASLCLLDENQDPFGFNFS